MGAGHAHGGDHGHGHEHDRAHDRHRLVLTLLLTAVILVAEVLGGLWSHSLALLSDAGHMLSDLAAQALSLVALAIATRPADARRTYGYYRIEILAALANGVALIGLAVWIFWSGYHRLRSGGPPIDLPVMTGIAGIGLAANLLGAYLLHSAQSLNVRGAYLHLLSDTLSSVVVMLGGLVMYLGGRRWSAIDPLLSMGIGLFITYSAFRLVRDAVDVLLEAVPLDVDLYGVNSALGRVQGVREVHDLHVWTITSGMRALSAHLVVDTASLPAADRVLGDVKALLAREFRITHSTIQIESGGYDMQGQACADCMPLGTRG
ncbi:MAG TPA: cation diffusion facilitator family transporter [Polyangia bacterium]|jgi:cobalt-zinc-cadmium efflux system protein|nr:cation diffusion facilitator family transporter [Polyangia bacterium]